MLKIVTIIGARPQFIKANILSKILKENFNEIVVHTGQHYDSNMSDIFFQELEMSKPEYNLKVGSNTHAKQTAEMMIKIEEVLEMEKPEAVLLYGDTNSTLAGALVAAKLSIPVFHVEGGVRTHCKDLPEEQNRILTDHLSDLIFLSTNENMNEMIKEGLDKRSYVVGDIMYDSLIYYTNKVKNNNFNEMIRGLKPIYPFEGKFGKVYYFFTLHRPENADNPDKVKEILEALDSLGKLVIFSVHPRIRKIMDKIYYNYKNIYYVEPLSYTETLYFSKNALKIITDSGGLHKEAYLHGTPCVSILRAGWVETNHGGWNHFVEAKKENIIKAVLDMNIEWEAKRNEFGNGKAAKKIVKIMLEYFQESGKC